MRGTARTQRLEHGRQMTWVIVLAALTGCYAAEPSSDADTNTSWLYPCDSQSDCAEDQACVANRCEPAEPSAEPSQSANAAASDERAGTYAGLERGEPLVLTEFEEDAGYVAARWVD